MVSILVAPSSPAAILDAPVQPKGIYCFFSTSLVKGLAERYWFPSCARSGRRRRHAHSVFIGRRREHPGHRHGLVLCHCLPPTWKKIPLAPPWPPIDPRPLSVPGPRQGTNSSEWCSPSPLFDFTSLLPVATLSPPVTGKEYGLQKRFSWTLDEKLSRCVLPPIWTPLSTCSKKKSFTNKLQVLKTTLRQPVIHYR